MKVYLRPPTGMSRAMDRVANALERYAPLDKVELTTYEPEADLLILHVIGLEAVSYRRHQRCAVLQYCVNSATYGDAMPWHGLWARATTIWSYYDLAPIMPEQWRDRLYHAPLGIDAPFRQPYVERPRDIGVMTSGYVNEHGQEAIESPTLAAQANGLKPLHLGPMPTGLRNELQMNFVHKISDSALARWYQRTQRVAAMRYVEGFEMPAIEGLANGARPVMFDRAETRRWFANHAEFVPECEGDELTARLTDLFARPPMPVAAPERGQVLEKFCWKPLATGFWNRILEGL